jgi:hypothetical protein
MPKCSFETSVDLQRTRRNYVPGSLKYTLVYFVATFPASVTVLEAAMQHLIPLNIGITSVRNKVILVLDFIVHFSHYMFRPRLAAIFRWFANTKISMAVTIYSTDPLSRHV